MSYVYSPTPVEEAYALYLLRSVFRRDYADTDFQLDGRSAVPFFTLSGQDRLILRNIWSVADPGNVGMLTNIGQFHTCLRLIALAQCGILGQALAVALQGQAAGSVPAPAVIMAACLQATAAATGVPLPRFAGIEMPPGAALQLIYRESRQHQQRPAAPGRSGSGGSHSALFLGYQNEQMMAAMEDSDRTVHTSNLHRTLTDDHKNMLGDTALEDGIAAQDGIAAPGPEVHPDTNSASQNTAEVSPLAATEASVRRMEPINGEDDDFGEFASTEPTGWDALDALVDIQDAPLPQLGAYAETEPRDSDHDEAENGSEPTDSRDLTPVQTAMASADGGDLAETAASTDENSQAIADATDSDVFQHPSAEIAVEVSSLHAEHVTNTLSNANDFTGDDDFGDFVDHAPNEVSPQLELLEIMKASPKVAGEISSSGASPVATTGSIQNKVIEDDNFGGFIDPAPTEVEPTVTEAPLSSPGLAGWDALDALAEHTIQVDASTTAHEMADSSFESTTVNVSTRSNLLDISHLGPVDDLDGLQEAATNGGLIELANSPDFGAIETFSDPVHPVQGAFDDSSNVLKPSKVAENTQSTELASGNAINPLSMPYGLERTVSLPVSPSRTLDALSGGLRPGNIERVSSAPGPSAGWDAFDELTTVQDAPLPTLHDMSANRQPGPSFSTDQLNHKQTHAENSDDFGAFDSATEFQTPSDSVSEEAPIISESKRSLTDSLVVNVSEPLHFNECEVAPEPLSSVAMPPEMAKPGHTPNIESIQSPFGNDERFSTPPMMKIENNKGGDDGSDDFGDFADPTVNEAERAPTSSIEGDFKMIPIAAATEPESASGFVSSQATTQATGSASPVPVIMADSGDDASGLIEHVFRSEPVTDDSDSFGDFDGVHFVSDMQTEASAAAQNEVSPVLDVSETDNGLCIAGQLSEATDAIMVTHALTVNAETGFSAPTDTMDSDDLEFGDFADFQEAPVTENSASHEILDLRSQIISRSLELPERILHRDDTTGSEYVDFGGCFDANIGTDQPLDNERSGRIRRCLQVMQLLSSSHTKLASTHWDQALIVIQDELVAGTKLLTEAANLNSKDFAPAVQKMTQYVHGLGEFVRISRSIAATLGDLLMLDQNALLTSDTLASSWCSMTLVQKTIQVERLWSDIEKKADVLTLVSKQNTDHRLENIVEIRSQSVHFDDPLCHFTLRPLGTDSASTKSSILWEGQNFMACTANFLSHRCPFYAVTS